MTDERFARELLDRWRDLEEVRVETSAGPGRPVHRTIIWVVVDELGRALVRSYRGAGARWYREATASGGGAIIDGKRRTAVRFERATDADRITSCSVQLERKYAGDPATRLMVRDDVLGTTLELRPA